VSTLRITFTPWSIAFDVDDQSGSIPLGPQSLAADLRHDPPQPEELTNVIGLVLDHMEDIEREVPGAMFADRVEVCGQGVDVIVAVEVGGAAELPFELTRDAAEDVFRTLVTEPARDRARNPGLPEPEVHRVLGVASALVGVLRFLRVDEVWVVAPPMEAA
jgi:exopolyphosphatase/guanosine-5'-triphosphate,3'-diphosphate pyrophosphatase